MERINREVVAAGNLGWTQGATRKNTLTAEYVVVARETGTEIAKLDEPPVFREYGAINVEWFASLEMLYSELEAVLKTHHDRCTEYIDENDRYVSADAEERVEGLKRKFSDDVDEFERRLANINSTFKAGSDKAWSNAYAVFKSRYRAERIDDLEQAFGAWRPTTSLSFQPTGIPVKLVLDSTGELAVVASGHVVTPIGVFSADTGFETGGATFLRVYHAGKAYCYNMGEEPFEMDFAEVPCRVSIKYLGGGTLEVFLLEESSAG